MLKKEFEFKKTFEKLGTSNFGKKQKAEYFGIDKKSDDYTDAGIKVLFYNNPTDFALEIATKGNDVLYIYKNSSNKPFNYIYEEIGKKSKMYRGDRNFTVDDRLKIPNLNKDYIYNLTVRKQEHNIHMFGGLINQILPFRMDERGFIVNTAANYVTLKGEIEEYNLSGSALMSGALKLNNEWCGTGIGDGVRVLGDFGSRVYYVKKI